jgi:hypothetical protein
VATGIQSFNLKQTLENLFGQIPNNEYFLIKATLVTLKDYGTLSALYNKTLENFHSFTNPIWIKQTSTFDIAENIVDFNYSVYPNPASDKLYFDFGNINAKNCIVKIIDITGKAVASKTGKADFIDISGIADGFYIVSVSADGNSVTKKFVVSHRK